MFMGHGYMDSPVSNSDSNKIARIRAPLINDCKELALELLGARLAVMFDEAEPALLDFAEMAETNQSQLRFVDTINRVKTAREQVESRFKAEIAKGFVEFLEDKPISYPSSISLPHPEGHLSIVNEEDLEKQVAIQKMVGRLHSECFYDIYAMGERMAMLHSGKKLREEDLPASPVHIATCFEIAAEDFNLEPEMLLITYLLFDKFVMRECGELFRRLNARLIEAGIFPNLRFQFPVNNKAPVQGADAQTAETSPPPQTPPQGAQGKVAAQQTTPSRQSEAPDHSTDTSLGDEIFQSICSLLSTSRQANPDYRDHPEVSPSAAPRKMVEPETLINAIDALQPSRDAPLLPRIEQGTAVATIEINAEVLREIRQILAKEQQQLFTNVDRNSIPLANLDTIELVGMLFNQMLDEEGLPNIAKALIGRLHTPYLKVAVIDRNFLIDKNHISRRLLDLMVEAGLKWVDEQDLRKGIYYPLQESITRILTEFKDDISIFSEIYNQLHQQIDQLEQKAKIIEARTREAAKGRERLEAARSNAYRIIEKRLGSNELPPPLERFLYHAWLDKMVLMILRDPDIENSAEWKDTLDVVDLVIWACQARHKPQVRPRLKERLGEISERIKSGLSSLGTYHQPDSDDLIALLEAYAALEDDQQTDIPSAAPAASKTAARPILPIKKPKRLKGLSEKETAMLEWLQKVEFGTWFQLSDTSGHSYHVKLSWFSPATKKCMFVNRAGQQVMVLPIDDLARQMCNGNAQIIKQPVNSFMDRALNHIRNLLTKALGSL